MPDLLTADGLARFSAAAAAQVGDETVPGLVALVARGDQVHVEALGSLSIGGPPVQRDSLFRIASTTKPVTGGGHPGPGPGGAARSWTSRWTGCCPSWPSRRVLRRMDGPLDDTVPARRPITVRDLLTFTFGFGLAAEMFAAPSGRGRWWRAADALHLATIGPPNPAEQPGPDTWIAGLGSLPLLAQPGERWFYNTGASVLGVLLARAAGQPFADVLRTRIFEPLGMRDTGFWTPHTEPARDRVPVRSGGRSGGLGQAGRPVERAAGVLATGPRGWSRPPTTCWRSPGCCCAAGIRCCRADLVAAMTRDQLTPGQKAAAASARASSPASLGLLHLGGHRRAAGRRVRLGWRIRHHLAGRPGAGPDRHRADPADVRQTRSRRRCTRRCRRRRTRPSPDGWAAPVAPGPHQPGLCPVPGRGAAMQRCAAHPWSVGAKGVCPWTSGQPRSSASSCTAGGRAWSGSRTGSPAIRVTPRTWCRRRSPAPTPHGPGSAGAATRTPTSGRS